MRPVHILGIGCTRLGRAEGDTVRSLTARAVSLALDDAGVEREQIQAAWFANTRQALMEGQNTIRGQVALRHAGITGIPVINVDNACASSSTGVHQAVGDILAGRCDVALVIGAERMFYPDKPKPEIFKAFLGSTDVTAVDEARALFTALGSGIGPLESDPAASGPHSFFMEMYAAIAKLHMKVYGTTQRQLAAVAAKNHRHSTVNPLAQYRFDMSVEQVLSDRLVTWPLTRAMCAPISDGAAALVLASDAAVRRLGASRAVAVRGIALRSSMDRDPSDFENQIGRHAGRAAYADAGLGPVDIDVAEVHDATSFAEILQTEVLGLVPFGAGGVAAERGDTALGGRLPINTSGGLVSKGHPIAATGIIQLHELVMQLRGEAGARQVAGARIALAENGGGFLGVEEAACVVTILEAPAR